MLSVSWELGKQNFNFQTARVMDVFDRKELEFSLPDSFKGLSKEYILDAIFNTKIQINWKPQEGDIIVGCTGNIFVISGESNLVPELGGKLFFFGGLLS